MKRKLSTPGSVASKSKTSTSTVPFTKKRRTFGSVVCSQAYFESQQQASQTEESELYSSCSSIVDVEELDSNVDSQLIDDLTSDSQISSIGSTTQSEQDLALTQDEESQSQSLGEDSWHSLFGSSQDNNSERQPRHYYLKNFIHILETVMEKDAHLFQVPEQKVTECESSNEEDSLDSVELEKIRNEAIYLDGFQKNLSSKAQRLFVRLYNRKWQWFQTIKLTSRYSDDFSQHEEEETENSKNDFSQMMKNESEETSSHEEQESSNSFGSLFEELITHRYVEQFSIDESPSKGIEEYEKNVRQILSSCTTAELELVAKRIRRFLPSKKLQQTQKKGRRELPSVSPKKVTLIDLIVSDTKSSNMNSAEKTKQKTIHSFFKATSNSQETTASPSDNSMKHLKNVYSAIESHFKTKFIRITPLAKEVFRRIHHLFFLDRSSRDASIMVLESKNIRKFPQYEYKPISVFKTRKDLDRYEQSIRLLSYKGEDEMEIYSRFQQDDDFDQNDQIEITMETLDKAVSGLCQETALYRQQKADTIISANEHYLLRFTAGWIYAKIVSMGVTMLEQQKLYEKATFHLRELLDSPFVSGRRGKWWNRLALDLQHMNQHKEALEICLTALREDKTLRTAQRYTLENRAERLNRKCKTWLNLSKELQFLDLKKARDVHIQSILMAPGQASRKSRFLSYDKQSNCTVEELALQYYLHKSRFSKGMHCEGSVWSTMFGLLFWDIIYDSSIPNVFQSKYQSAPLDLGTDAFFASRQDKIEQRLLAIREDNESFMENTLRTVWQEQYGVDSCVGKWDSFSIQDLVDICHCFTGAVISAVCRMLSEDYRHNRSGMPDLILWSPETRTALFSEVKGPRDRLSDKQHAWIDVLLASGAEVEICHVAEKSLSPKKNVTFDDNDLWALTSNASQQSTEVCDLTSDE